MKNQIKSIGIVLTILIAAGGLRGQELAVLGPEIMAGPGRDMMKRYLLKQAGMARQRWLSEYNSRTTAEEIGAYQKRLRRQFVEALGGFPERTPLNPQVTGTIKRDGYIVEKVIFESRPKHYVTAALFLPQPGRFTEPYPGVLVPCGHSRNGKASGAYQRGCALLALNGMAALIFDPIDQGERGQMLNEKQLPVIWGTQAHTMLGVGSILLGRNTATYRVWDGMRSIDYLAGRKDIDGSKIGATGCSGGGTLTSYLMALDDRVACAAPSCYLTSFRRLIDPIGPQDAEQNVHAQIAFGMDHADSLMMRAPKPTLILASTHDFFDIQGTWDTFRQAKRFYTRLGFAERVDLVETDAKHGYPRLQREAMLRWMRRWLAGIDEPTLESEIETLPADKLRCSPRGQVLLIEGARSVVDLNVELNRQLKPQRDERWKPAHRESALAEVRRLAGERITGESRPGARGHSGRCAGTAEPQPFSAIQRHMAGSQIA